MRASRLSFLVLSLLSAGIFSSAQPTRTMDSLVQAALQQGELGKIGKRDAKTFHIPPETPTRTVWYDQGTLDEHEHVFKVILKADGQPDALLLQSSVMTEDETGRRLKGRNFLLTPSGEIKVATEFNGIAGKLTDKRLSTKAATSAFEHEKLFWFKKSADREFSK